MELLQKISDFTWNVYVDGTDVANPGIYTNMTDSIGYWAEESIGLALTDGKLVKQEVLRIVNLEDGADIDEKFGNLENDSTKLIAGQEILFDLLKSTLVPSIMSDDEYEAARQRRQILSAEAREKRWNSMLVHLSDPAVLVELSKISLLDDVLRLYQTDYIPSDNKIFEAFITGTDHALNGLVGYSREGVLDFATTPSRSLMGLVLWDNPVNAPYKTLVTDIIKNHIINVKHYYTEH